MQIYAFSCLIEKEQVSVIRGELRYHFIMRQLHDQENRAQTHWGARMCPNVGLLRLSLGNFLVAQCPKGNDWVHALLRLTGR